MNLNTQKLNVIKDAIAELKRYKFICDIYDTGCGYFAENEILFQVNWGAYGDQNPADARQYGFRIMKAADIAGMLNSIFDGYEYTSKDLALDIEEAREIHKKAISKAADALLHLDHESLKEALDFEEVIWK